MAEDVNPWAGQNWNLTAQTEYLKRYGVARAAARANDAGAVLGGPRPMIPDARQYLRANYVFQKQLMPATSSKPLHEFLGFYAAGTFSPSQYFTLSAVPKMTKFPTTNLPDESIAQCSIAPNADTEFYLTNNLADFITNGTSVICTISFAAGQNVGTFVYGAPIVLPIDTVLYVVCSSLPDPLIAGAQILFCGDPA